MEHIGIDLGGRESQLRVRSSNGSVVQELRLGTTSIQEFLKQRPKSRVILETCAESFAIAEQARTAGHEVRVVPATLGKALGVGQRRFKNERSRDVIALVSVRNSLVRARTQLINSVRG